MKKLNLLAASLAAVVIVGGASVLTATSVNAQSDADTLIERLASKFNLNQEEVQQVFDEFKNEREAERKAEFSEYLQDKVDKGEITAEQKTAIEEKLASLQDTRETERDELEAWAEQHNIDMKYVLGRHGNNDRLDDAVEDGDLSEAQRDLIETKLNELEGKRDTVRDELEAWADEQGIDLKDIMPFGGNRGGRRF